MSLFYNEQTHQEKGGVILLTAGLVVMGLIIAWLAIGPAYRVWSQGKRGEAAYAEAEQDRRIRILEAEAKKESAKLEAEAEVERAKGVASANLIIADGLKGHDEYLRYLWITNLEEGEQREVIYVPTEAGLPILEAGKR